MSAFTMSASRVRRGFTVMIIVGAGLAFRAEAVRAEVAWHDNLPTARAAGAASGKPVLAIFLATWSPEAMRFREQTLQSAEVKGLIEACFEATMIDVDAEPGLTRRMQVSHVPSACIFGEKGPPLASFECSEQPLAFLAAAGKASQEAAAARALSAHASQANDLAKPAGLSASGFTPPAVDGDPLAQSGVTATDAAARGSISLVTAKVRQLSDFATGVELEPASEIPRTARGTHDAPAAPGAAQPPDRLALAEPPTLPATPPAWPAEQPAAPPAFTNTTQAASARPEIEPAGSAAVPAPWLTTPPAASPGLPEQPEASATATDLPSSKTDPSAWSSFMAAITKPFTKAQPQASPPPTMPAARPAAPLADALTTAIAPRPAVDAAAPADPYGSMPLGLEGYCPVTVADRGVWTEGRAQWGVRHRGRTYLFAGPEQQQAFLTAPDRYAPVLSGDDPVVVFDQGRSTPGRRAFGVTYQSRMYLFSSPETRAAFAANPDRYTSSVMLAERQAPVDAARRY